jgi:hypothetical protein
MIQKISSQGKLPQDTVLSLARSMPANPKLHTFSASDSPASDMHDLIDNDLLPFRYLLSHVSNALTQHMA